MSGVREVMKDESFDQLLGILGDETTPLPVARLYDLSDLDLEHVDRFFEHWTAISESRRQEIIDELGHLADDHIELTYEPINRRAMHDPDPSVRRQAIENLWECEDPKLIQPLLDALRDDPEAEVRSAAATALGAFVYLGEVEELALDLLMDLEHGLLRATEQDPVEEVRRKGLESLGYSSNEAVPALIERAYDSGGPEGVVTALRAMGRSANDRWRDHVLAELLNPDPLVRVEAVQAAGELELREATSELLELLEDVDSRVRWAAIWSLGQLGGREAAVALTELLEATDDNDEASLLEDALDNLAFVDGTRDFLLFDFEDPEDLIE